MVQVSIKITIVIQVVVVQTSVLIIITLAAERMQRVVFVIQQIILAVLVQRMLSHLRGPHIVRVKLDILLVVARILQHMT